MDVCDSQACPKRLVRTFSYDFVPHSKYLSAYLGVALRPDVIRPIAVVKDPRQL